MTKPLVDAMLGNAWQTDEYE